MLSFTGRIFPRPRNTAENISTSPAMNRTGCGLYFLTIRYPIQNVTINEITIPKTIASFFFVAQKNQHDKPRRQGCLLDFIYIRVAAETSVRRGDKQSSRYLSFQWTKDFHRLMKD